MSDFIWDNDDLVGLSLDNFEKVLNYFLIEQPEMRRLLEAAMIEHNHILTDYRKLYQDLQEANSIIEQMLSMRKLE